jgi:hypothetical protein
LGAFRSGRVEAVHGEERPLGHRLGQIPPRIERSDDLAGRSLLHGDERIVAGHGLPILANLVGNSGDRGHHRVLIGEQLVPQPQGVHLVHPFRQRGADHAADHGLRKRPVECEIDVGNACRGRKPALVRRVVAAEGANVVQRPRFATHHPVAGHQFGAGGVLAPGLEHGLVEAGRQRIDQIDIARELAVLLLGDAPGDEDAEMTH